MIDLVATVRGQNHEPTAIFTSETEYATFGKLKTGIASDKTPLEMPKYLDGSRGTRPPASPRRSAPTATPAT